MRKAFKTSSKEVIASLLDQADIVINGSRPWDIQVFDERFYDHILLFGSLGLGESYLGGWWESESLDQFFYKLLRGRIDRNFKACLPLVIIHLKSRILNRQNLSRSGQVGVRHYDLGNELFEHMLDTSMSYSCGYWQNAGNLEQAQQAKLDMICRKLQLDRGMRLLDIGCGWGGLVEYAARNYGVEAVGITISKEQVKLARKRCGGLPIEIRQQDYREVRETFDAIVSVGMFEHVGYKNYQDFMEMVSRSLRKNGLFLLHTIASNKTTYNCDPWFDKYIFPNGMLPSARQLAEVTENCFVLEDWHNFGTHYDKTLLAWYRNFETGWPQLQDKYGGEFFRMWKYYLLSLAGGFRARHIQLWQIVYSSCGLEKGYQSIRCLNCA